MRRETLMLTICLATACAWPAIALAARGADAPPKGKKAIVKTERASFDASSAVQAVVPMLPPGPAKSWADCVRAALSENPDVVSAQRGYDSAVALRKGTWSPFLPALAGVAAVTRSGGADAFQYFSDQSLYSANLTLSQNLFSGFADLARRDKAKAAEASAAAALRVARSKAISDLATAFQGLAYAKEARLLSEEILARRDQNMRLVELRFESGRENKGSVLLSQANLEQAKYDLLRSIDQIPAAQALLRRALGDPDLAIDVAGDVPVAPPPPPPADFERLAAELPEAIQSREQVNSSRADLTTARSGFWPTLDLRGQIGRQGDDSALRQERWSGGLTLTIPFFNGGRDWFGTQSASALVSSTEATFAGLLRQLAANLINAYEGYVESAQKLKVDGIYVDATQARAEIARRKYENGLLSFEDWDIIENDLINRQRTFITSKRDRALAERAWRQAISQEETP